LNNTRFNHRQVWQLALPMIIANISTPLLGLVDTAVMGHLDNASFLAAVALAGLIFNFLFWGFGFLRMGIGISWQVRSICEYQNTAAPKTRYYHHN
jgi:MATE family multidrug resistance protein